jgi:hypothetical protein
MGVSTFIEACCRPSTDSLATVRPPSKESSVRTLITIAIAAVLVIGAIALGIKFFNTSVSEQEEGKDWDKDE